MPDYGMGQTNIDNKTGIRYGVISQHDVGEGWYEGSESDYGKPCCPKCGNEAVEIDDKDVPDWDEMDSEELSEWIDDGHEFACVSCKYTFDGDNAFPDEPLGHYIKDEQYEAWQGGDDTDIFIIKSPYYTLCNFCSPCAPGAGYLTNEGNVMAYCFGHDMYYEGNEAPYRVFRVSDHAEVVMDKVPKICPNCNGSGRDSLERVAKARGISLEEMKKQGIVLPIDGKVDEDGTFGCWRCQGKGSTLERVERIIPKTEEDHPDDAKE